MSLGGAANTLVLAIALVVVDCFSYGYASNDDNQAKSDDSHRLLVFISDSHMGLGCKVEGDCDPREDFRWPNALRGFLEEIGKMGGNAVDLVIAGDFLELWQPPDDVACEGKSADLGCSVEEMQEITRRALKAHADAIGHLRDFSRVGENRLYLIPGNHDSSLTNQSVWALLEEALDTESDRAVIVKDGIWVSPDGRVVAEHGHQIGSDVNKYGTWPSVTKTVAGNTYVIRPWGERFVQQIFNEQEAAYPIIDNLSPESAGIRYRMADRGVWKTVDDMATFLAFNIWETSLSQKTRMLGGQRDASGAPVWDVRIGREMGYRLFSGALSEDDPFRSMLLEDTPGSTELRKSLDKLAADMDKLPDQDVRLLCDQIAIRGHESLCEDLTLGATIESLLIPRKQVLRSHLEKTLEQHNNMKVFIYGHTHKLEEAWELKLTKPFSRKVTVLNAGAFQRLIDDEAFLEKAEKSDLSPEEALREFDVEDLPPCYGVVIVHYENGRPEPEAMMWNMEEGGKGRLMSPGACR